MKTKEDGEMRTNNLAYPFLCTLREHLHKRLRRSSTFAWDTYIQKGPLKDLSMYMYASGLDKEMYGKPALNI